MVADFELFREDRRLTTPHHVTIKLSTARQHFPAALYSSRILGIICRFRK